MNRNEREIIENNAIEVEYLQSQIIERIGEITRPRVLYYILEFVDGITTQSD